LQELFYRSLRQKYLSLNSCCHIHFFLYFWLQGINIIKEMMYGLFVTTAFIVFGVSIVLKAMYGKWERIPLLYKAGLITAALGCILWFSGVESAVFPIGENTAQASCCWAVFTSIFSFAVFSRFRQKENIRQARF
jgi:hypothetical protein